MQLYIESGFSGFNVLLHGFVGLHVVCAGVVQQHHVDVPDVHLLKCPVDGPFPGLV